MPRVSVRHTKKAWVLAEGKCITFGCQPASVGFKSVVFWFLQALWRVIASTASIGTVQTRPAVAVRILRGAARGMSKPAGRSCIPPPRTTSAICFRLENGVQPSSLATASRHGASNLRSRGTSRGCFLPDFKHFPRRFLFFLSSTCLNSYHDFQRNCVTAYITLYHLIALLYLTVAHLFIDQVGLFF